MSAWKPLAVSLVICGVFGTTANADPIPWPSGLDNWLIYLSAAPSGSQGTGPAQRYTVPSPAVITPQVPTASPVSAAPAAAQAVISSPAPPQPAPVSVSISSPRPAPVPIGPEIHPKTTSPPAAFATGSRSGRRVHSTRACVQPSMVQPGYVHSPDDIPASQRFSPSCTLRRQFFPMSRRRPASPLSPHQVHWWQPRPLRLPPPPPLLKHSSTSAAALTRKRPPSPPAGLPPGTTART